MAVRTIDCTACGSSVPYGRLSCPACGELLASVAGAMRPLRSVAAVAEPDSLAGPTWERPDRPADLTAPRTESTTGPGPEPASQPGFESEVEPQTALQDEPGPPTADEPGPPTTDEPGPTHDEVERSRAELSWPPAIEDARALGPALQPESGPPSPAWPPPAQPLGAGAYAALPGAYLPPSSSSVPHIPAFAPAAPAVTDAPALPAPARAWAGLRADEPPTAGHDRPSATDELRALTDPAKRDEMIGWLAVAGGTLASLGFLLPWSRVVIGSNGVGYFASWGFAGPGHLLVVVALLAMVALALVGVRVPAAIRLGAPGLLLGGLIIGLSWPYLIGPLGALPGVWLSLFGAATLTVASIAAIVGTRHGDRAQDV